MRSVDLGRSLDLGNTYMELKNNRVSMRRKKNIPMTDHFYQSFDRLQLVI